jgi:hypothetical protein
MAKSQTIEFTFAIDPMYVDKRDALVAKIERTLLMHRFRVLAGEYTVTIERKSIKKGAR